MPSPWLPPEDTNKCAMFLSLEELTMRVGDRDDDVSAKLNAGGLGRSTGKTGDSLRG